MATLVQSASNSATSGTTVTVTLGAAATSGNCLIVKAGNATGSTALTVTGVKIGGSADNFALAKRQTEATDGTGIEIWTDQNIGVSSTSVVVTFSGTINDAAVIVEEWSGIALTGAVDKTNGASSTTTSFSSGASGTLAQASEVVVGAVFCFTTGSPTITGPSSPWTNLSQVTVNGAALGAGYIITSTNATQTYSGTFTGSLFESSAAVIVTLLAASAVAGTVQPRATLPPARRQPRRAWLQFKPVITTNAAPPPPVSGTVQPQAAVPAPRRKPARAISRGIAVPGVYGTAPAQQFRTPPRRKTARAQVRFTPVTTTNAPLSRTLLISLASKAGIDDYGNPFPKGIAIGAANGPQIKLGANATGAGIVQIDVNDSRFLPGEVNSAVGGSPNYDSLGIIGPASTAAGHGDFVEEAFNSANAAGSSTANWEIFYVDTTGVPNLVAVVDANGFTFNKAMTANSTATFNVGAAVTNGLTTDTLTTTGDASVNSANLNVGNGSTANINLNPKMATPPNAAAVAAGTATLAQLNAFCNGLYTSLKNRGMFN